MNRVIIFMIKIEINRFITELTTKTSISS